MCPYPNCLPRGTCNLASQSGYRAFPILSLLCVSTTILDIGTLFVPILQMTQLRLREGPGLYQDPSALAPEGKCLMSSPEVAPRSFACSQKPLWGTSFTGQWASLASQRCTFTGTLPTILPPICFSYLERSFTISHPNPPSESLGGAILPRSPSVRLLEMVRDVTRAPGRLSHCACFAEVSRYIY